jgi:hypothetical protein
MLSYGHTEHYYHDIFYGLTEPYLVLEYVEGGELFDFLLAYFKIDCIWPQLRAYILRHPP